MGYQAHAKSHKVLKYILIVSQVHGAISFPFPRKLSDTKNEIENSGKCRDVSKSTKSVFDFLFIEINIILFHKLHANKNDDVIE